MRPDNNIERPVIINIEEDDEPLKGRPRTVHLQKTDYHLGQSVASLAVITDHDTGGRVTERRVYRPDGTLSFHETFQYEADPPGCTVQILDAQGAIVSTRRILTGPEGEESIVTSASGEISEKTKTRRDSEGRVIEAVSEDMIANKEIRMLVDYRAGLVEAHVTLPQRTGAPPDIHIVRGRGSAIAIPPDANTNLLVSRGAPLFNRQMRRETGLRRQSLNAIQLPVLRWWSLPWTERSRTTLTDIESTRAFPRSFAADIDRFRLCGYDLPGAKRRTAANHR